MASKSFTREKAVSKGVISELRAICAGILRKVESLGYCDNDIFAIHLAMEEAIVNAVKHGNRHNADKTVTIEYDITPDRVEIAITDEGSGFEPNGLADPRAGNNIYKTGGRGVLLIKSYMDKVEYNNAGNSVRMVKFNARRAG